MDLEKVKAEFLQHLRTDSRIERVSDAKMAGIPFLYVQVRKHIDIERKEVQALLEQAAVKAMKGKRLHSEMIYVRHEDQEFVYRFRFFVPQEKMFCCGNLCHDCIRFRV
jgi:hypothetical protein